MQESKQCQNCKQNFTIESEDFDFYKKMEVPPPTFCPECRMQRRFAWRNERAFFRHKCAKTGKNIIAAFSPESGMTVYDRDEWWKDDWDPISYGREYNFEKPFFLQFKELLKTVPVPSVFNARTVNCFYTQHTGDFKNGYLVMASWGGEDVSYAARVQRSKDSMDVFVLINGEMCYECVGVSKSYKLFFSCNCDGCDNSYFLYNCKGCSSCVGCVNLRNKSYYIFNVPYSKEEYAAKVKELNLSSREGLHRVKEEFEKLKLHSIQKFANITNSANVTGDNISNCSNSRIMFDAGNGVKDCKYLQNALEMNDSYDGYGVGAGAELLYESFDTGVRGFRECFCGIVYGGIDIFYSYNCHNCKNCFGCANLQKKEYCILNKQYSKEEYEMLRAKIVSHMNMMPYIDTKGRIYKYGEFFPVEFSPFGYNKTVAQEYFPLTREEIKREGYVYEDDKERNYIITKAWSDLPDDISKVEDNITNEIIRCKHGGQCEHQCSTAFKIIPTELQFYRRFNLPIPELCPNCRHYERLQQRNPLKLWHRKCQCVGKTSENGVYTNTSRHQHGEESCPNEFETSYAPERPEIVYCEQCYQAEVM